MDWSSDGIGFALLGIGTCLTLWFRKRRFDRTNAFGVQRFSNFWSMIAARTKDLVLEGSSILLLCSGVIMLAFNHLDSWGWIVALPVLGFTLFVLIGL